MLNQVVVGHHVSTDNQCEFIVECQHILTKAEFKQLKDELQHYDNGAQHTLLNSVELHELLSAEEYVVSYATF